MQVYPHLAHTWLFACVLLLTVHTIACAYGAPWRPGCGSLNDQNHDVDQPIPPVTSCQLNPIPGAPRIPGYDPYLQLNICNPPGETETFVFSAGMYESWSTCLSCDNTEWCQVTSRGTNVVNVTRGLSSYMPHVNVTRGLSSYMPHASAFVCHQPNTDTMHCQRKPTAISSCDIAVFCNAYSPAPSMCLVWNGSQTSVFARCPADSDLCLGYSVRSCSQSAAAAGPAADPSRLPRDNVIGIAVGCVLVVALLVALVAVYVIRRRRQQPPTSTPSSVQSTHSPKRNTVLRPQLHAHSSRTKSMAGHESSFISNGGRGPGRNSNSYTGHSQVSGSPDQAGTADDHTYATIDVALAVSSEYTSLDETTNYSHAYKTVLVNDPNLRPPMPLPLHVTGQPFPYYSAAEANGAVSAYGHGASASGVYVDLLEDNAYPDLAVSGGYLLPVSPSSYLQESGQQPGPAISLVSHHITPERTHDRQMPVY